MNTVLPSILSTFLHFVISIIHFRALAGSLVLLFCIGDTIFHRNMVEPRGIDSTECVLITFYIPRSQSSCVLSMQSA